MKGYHIYTCYNIFGLHSCQASDYTQSVY